jgi:hypothetical protein
LTVDILVSDITWDCIKLSDTALSFSGSAEFMLRLLIYLYYEEEQSLSDIMSYGRGNRYRGRIWREKIIHLWSS